MTTQQILRVEGMSCAGCEANIRRGLIDVPGVDDVFADHGAKTVRVAFDPGSVDITAIRHRIEELGFEVLEA